MARLASETRGNQLSAVVEVIDAAGLDVFEVMLTLEETEDESLDVMDLVEGLLCVGTGRPWETTVGLCSAVVRQWSIIRGRLINQGIADPLRALPSLTALLDVVEVMILDGMESEEKRESYLREMYRPRLTADPATPPPGWSDGADLDGLV